MEWKNEVTALLRIAYPIIQTPMLGMTTPEMVLWRMAGLRAKAQQADRKEFTNLWAGRVSVGAENRSSADIFTRLITETEALHIV